MAYNPHSSSTNLLGTLDGQITADDESAAEEGRAGRPPAPPSSSTHLQPPSARGSVPVQGVGSTDGEGNIFTQSAHPVALFFLFFFRCAAIATYLLCGFFSSSYVFSTVLVVVLLSLDFWTVRNVSGRVLVGLRFWNQVDDDGTSFWVFESRSPSQPSNAVDSKMFWIAMYAFPGAWILLLFVGILKFNLSFLPIVMLALVFNVTNTVGYTYADRDAKRRWATGMAAHGMLGQMGGIGGSVVSGIASSAFGRFFG
ncbi:RHTO0S14e00210g1_1 [Rhodotorula toruloides]|uniref:Golgi apparatus membrane protein TVP23 n=1 Tax=Rhodotorula toruloides TaxID=5286 RepID=A0A061BB32_RHOTO|nr:RHTO0S14e00210g1_1 [Rhodotorula toruloides]